MPLVRPDRPSRTALSRRALLSRAAGAAAGAALPTWLAGCGGGWPAVASAGKGRTAADAIVIGAGAAGLACAHALLAAGVDVLVLEASARRHGRVRSTSSLTTIPVELGAEWIHGTNSPLYEIAVRRGARLAAEAPRDRVFSGGLLPTTEFLFGESDFAAAKAFVDAAGGYSGPPRSGAQRIDDAGLAARTRRWLDAALGNDRGTTNARLDALALAQAITSATAGSARLALESPSFAELLDAEYDDVLPRIQYGTPIRHIDWSGTSGVFGPRPIAYTAAFSPYVADVIVVTVPLAILQRGDLDFTPTPPVAKQQAIGTIGVDAALKAVLRFSTRFWPADIGALFGGSAVARYDATGVGRGIANDLLTATAFGDDARTLSASGNPIGRMLADLDDVFGAGAASGRYLAGEFVDWKEELWIGGGVSYPSAGSDEVRAALAAPMGRVFFAGEATHTGGHFGTLHGAIETGVRAASEVLAARIA